MSDTVEYIAELPNVAAVNDDGEVCIGPVSFKQRLVRCRDCISWKAPIAYTPTGKCTLHDRITNRNFYCADGREKDG